MLHCSKILIGPEARSALRIGQLPICEANGHPAPLPAVANDMLHARAAHVPIGTRPALWLRRIDRDLAPHRLRSPPSALTSARYEVLLLGPLQLPELFLLRGNYQSSLVFEGEHDARATEPDTGRRAALCGRVLHLAGPRQAWRAVRVLPRPPRDRSRQGDELHSGPECRKLNAVADHALALAGRRKLHLLQKRHRDGDYSYWAVARAPGGSIEQAPDRLPTGRSSQPATPITSNCSVSKRTICEAVKGR